MWRTNNSGVDRTEVVFQQQVSHLLVACSMSATAPAQADQVAIGDWLSSSSSNYLVLSFLGQGTFGKVAKCTRMHDKRTIAIMMMTNQGSLVRQAEEEVQVANPESPADKVAIRSDELIFVDMLDKMLELDAASRITPRQVLEHQFVSMDHLVCMYRDSSHVKSCFLLMDSCRNNTPASDSGELESRSLQQDYARTSQPVRQNISPFAERNYLS
ncbi:hypothetical protein ABVT39_016444 [Epinephelus coioides]